VGVRRIDIPNLRAPAGPNGPIGTEGVTVCINEKIAESVVVSGTRAIAKAKMFTPGSWPAVREELRLDPREMARRIATLYPGGRILIIIREQAEWLSSAYRYFLPRLPPQARSFGDFCATPRGIAYLEAGHYDRTIQAYGETFGLQNVCVLRFEQLRRSPDEFVAAICGFLGVTPMSAPEGIENESSSATVTRLRRRLPALERIPAHLRVPLRLALSHVQSAAPILPAELQATIRAFYSPSNARTDVLLASMTDAGGR